MDVNLVSMSKEKHGLWAFENVQLRKISVAKKDEVKTEWRKLYNEGLHHLYSSPNIIRVIKSRIMRWAGHTATMGERESYMGAYRVLVGKPEGKTLLARPRCR
jgi:hypothetical protein